MQEIQFGILYSKELARLTFLKHVALLEALGGLLNFYKKSLILTVGLKCNNVV